MAKPSDDGRFGALLDGDSSGSSHGSAADRRGMLGHDARAVPGKIHVPKLKVQEGHDRAGEILDVNSLGLLASAGISLLAFLRILGGSLGIQFRAHPFDRGCRRPHAS